MTGNSWQLRRSLNHWTGDGLVEWIDHGTAYVSVVFTWKLMEAAQRIAWHKAMGRKVEVGGPAVALMPGILPIRSSCNVSAVSHHNPDAVFTSRGCIRQCPFCAVPRIEGDLIELDDWEPRPIVCDNNLLACSRKHFDGVVDGLKPIPEIDFNQGLDARLLTPYHAGRLAELDLKMVRLAWDDMRYEQSFMSAFDLLRSAGIPKAKITCYVLIGFRDTPEDALYRLDTVWNRLKIWPFPMRYQPLDCFAKNTYVGRHWTDAELRRYMKYWSNIRHLSGIPFAEYEYTRRASPVHNPQQARMAL